MQEALTPVRVYPERYPGINGILQDPGGVCMLMCQCIGHILYKGGEESVLVGRAIGG